MWIVSAETRKGSFGASTVQVVNTRFETGEYEVGSLVVVRLVGKIIKRGILAPRIGVGRESALRAAVHGLRYMRAS